MNKYEAIIESLELSNKRKKIDLSSIPDNHKNGDCFEVAIKQMMEFYDKGVKNIKLVHGIVNGQGKLKGLQFCHAWVEINSTVIDLSNNRNVIMPKKQYYELGEIEITKIYKYKEMLDNIIKYETYGPWDKIFDNYL